MEMHGYPYQVGSWLLPLIIIMTMSWKSGFGRFFYNSQNKLSLGTLSAGLLSAICLLYLRPYHGIRHDSVLYLGQALLIREPQQFASDLFFAYGSQSRYTFFPEVVAWLLGYFRPAETFLALTFLSLLAFAATSYVLIRVTFPKVQHFYALLALLILPGGYGGQMVFGYAEPFFTGRSIAEPLVLVSIAAWITRRRTAAVVLWLLAASIHPLQALSLAALVFGVLISKNKRWWHLLWLVLPLLALGFLGFSPFDKLLVQQGAEWHAWIAERTPQVFISSWSYQTWGYWLTDIFLGWLVIQYAPGYLRTLAKGAIVATVLGMLATLVFADFLELVLPTGLQLWRAQWILHWVSMACVPLLFLHHWNAAEKYSRSRAVLLLGIVMYGAPLGAIAPSSLISLGLMAFYFSWPLLAQHMSVGLMRLISNFPWFVLFLGVVKYIQGVWGIFTKMAGAREAIRPEFMLMTHPLITASILFVGVFLWRTQVRARIFLTIALVFVLVGVLGSWDRRMQWTKNIESQQYSSDIFGFELPPGAQIFWENDLLPAWLVLGRPSFKNSEQYGGISFNHETAVEIIRREKFFEIFDVQKQICNVANSLNSDESCQVDVDVIKDICLHPGGPDYMVLSNRISIPPQGTWSMLGGIKGDRYISYYIYKCSSF